MFVAKLRMHRPPSAKHSGNQTADKSSMMHVPVVLDGQQPVEVAIRTARMRTGVISPQATKRRKLNIKPQVHQAQKL